MSILDRNAAPIKSAREPLPLVLEIKGRPYRLTIERAVDGEVVHTIRRPDGRDPRGYVEYHSVLYPDGSSDCSCPDYLWRRLDNDDAGPCKHMEALEAAGILLPKPAVLASARRMSREEEIAEREEAMARDLEAAYRAGCTEEEYFEGHGGTGGHYASEEWYEPIIDAMYN